MLPGAINFHRSGFNVNLNDKSGITLSSLGNLSVSGGSVSISGGSVSINGSSKIKVQKGKSGYISLENEFYSEAGSTCECGSDRQSYGPFTDDETTAGVKEALAKLRNENGIIEETINGNLTFAMAGAQPALGMPATFDDSLANRAAMCNGKNVGRESQEKLVPSNESEIPISGDDLKNKEDVPEFNSNICHEEGTYVKEKVNGEYVLGNERHILVSTGYKSYFDPVDKTSTGIFNKEQLQVLGRLMIYSIPYVGQAIFIGETISGYDAFTGRKLSAEERIYYKVSSPTKGKMLRYGEVKFFYENVQWRYERITQFNK